MGTFNSSTFNSTTFNTDAITPSTPTVTGGGFTRYPLHRREPIHTIPQNLLTIINDYLKTRQKHAQEA